MGIMTYSMVVLLFGVVLGAIFANAVRAGIATVRGFFSYLKAEAKENLGDPVE